MTKPHSEKIQHDSVITFQLHIWINLNEVTKRWTSNNNILRTRFIIMIDRLWLIKHIYPSYQSIHLFLYLSVCKWHEENARRQNSTGYQAVKAITLNFIDDTRYIIVWYKIRKAPSWCKKKKSWSRSICIWWNGKVPSMFPAVFKLKHQFKK